MLKTFKFISFIIALTVAVIAQATPTIPNVSMLTYAPIVMIGD